MNACKENEVARDVVDAAYQIHREIGPGLLESVYEALLAHELRLRGRKVEAQAGMPVEYPGVRFDLAFRADLIVDDVLIVELKSVEQLIPVHGKQLLTYLRVSGRKLGLLINFGVCLFKDGVKRVVNGLEE